MKILRKLMLMLLCAVPMMAMAQTENPVKWKHAVADKGNGLYTVELRAEIGEGWHIYVTDPAYTLNPTTLEFAPGKGVTTEGELRSLSKANLVKDEYGLTASGQEGYFENEALFEQDFKVEGEGGNVTVKVFYQACNVWKSVV